MGASSGARAADEERYLRQRGQPLALHSCRIKDPCSAACVHLHTRTRAPVRSFELRHGRVFANTRALLFADASLKNTNARNDCVRLSRAPFVAVYYVRIFLFSPYSRYWTLCKRKGRSVRAHVTRVFPGRLRKDIRSSRSRQVRQSR